MAKSVWFGLLTAVLGLAASAAPAQDPDEVAGLRAQVEQLKKENELLQKENELLKKEHELLKKECELLKKEAKERPDTAKEAKGGALSDLLAEGTVLQGTFRAAQGGGHGEVTLTISERDGKKIKATSLLRQMKDDVEVGTSEGEVEGTINGNRLSWTNVGSANKTNATLLLKGDGLEGTYRTQAGISGTIGLKIAE